MKRLFALICGALLAGASVAATTVPVQLLNPAGSSAGQAIVSTGASSAPEWTTVPLLNGANTWSSAQVFNGSVNANAGLSVGSANMIFPTASGLSFGVQNSFIGEADYEASAPTGNRATYRYIDPNGVLHYTFYNDTFTSGVDWLTIQRSGNSASSIVFSVRPSFNGATPYDTSNLTFPSCSTSSSVLQYASGSGLSCATGISGRLLNVQVFTSSATYTPTAGTTKAIVRVVGGGGAGGGTQATSTGQSAIGQPGSSGSYAEVYWTNPTTQTVTIGTGGTAVAGGNGGSGGSTSVGSVVVCPGGVGGAAGTPASNTTAFTVGAAGLTTLPTVSGATVLNLSQGNQGSFSIVLNANYTLNGQGGASPLSGGFSNAALSGGAYGAGGAAAANGASSAASAGQAGMPGRTLIYEYQ